MFEEKQEDYQVPTQPTIRPIDNLDIEEFSLEIDLEPMTLEREMISRSEEEIKIESQISLDDYWQREEPEDCQNQNSFKRRHLETREFGNTIRRSMLSKLDQMERAYILKHLVPLNGAISDLFFFCSVHIDIDAFIILQRIISSNFNQQINLTQEPNEYHE